MTLAAGSTLGPYEVTELLGPGGMGEVYRARDPRLGRAVALKILPPEVATDPDRLQRFEREAKAIAALSHPHILTVYDVGTDDGRPYVVTELLEGETLREVLARRSPTPRQTLDFAVQVAQGLAAAHRKGVFHRDLKPETLFVTTAGRIKILDLGLARLIAPAEDGDTTGPTEVAPTGPGVLLNTVASLSPEQVQALPLDARTDIFSMGVVLYELVSGQHPFVRDTVPATLTAIVSETPPDLGSRAAGITPALSGIVSRCLEKRPEDRFQTAHDLALALEAVLQAPSGSATLVELEERSPYPGLRSFTEKDAGAFFGREAEVEELWGRIRNRKLLAVIGPSGVGKTSFIRAGVVAHRPEGWGAIVATPGDQPFRSLGRTLGPELVGDTEALGKLVDFEDPDTAFELLGRWRHRHDEALLVLDQFEELFTLNPPEVQERFAGLLGRLSREADVHVVLSLRDDFLMGCHDHEPLTAVFRELTPLGALKADDLRRALVEPAKKQGYQFEDEALVDEMVDSVEGARAALPLLAFAVSRLWERRDREKKVLRRESYEAIGGVAGALAQHAEQTLERIGSERQPLVREIFRNLVTSQGTRAVADRDELLSVFAGWREPAGEVLHALIDSRLLTSYEVESGADSHSTHRIEIAHESLLKAWPRLVRWQAQDEEGAVLRDQLKQAAHLWQEKGRNSDVLWSGTAYQEFDLWRQRYPGKLTVLEEEFARSMVERDRRRRRVRRFVGVAVVVIASTVAATTGALWLRSEVARARAEASGVLALAQARLPEDPTEALALTTASLALADTPEARLFAMRALWTAPPAVELDHGHGEKQLPSFSPDGRWLAASGLSTEVVVWPRDGGDALVLPGHSFGENQASWASEELLVTGIKSSAERVHVWAFPGGSRVRTIELGRPSYWVVGPRRLLAETGPEAAASRRCLLRSWLLPEGEEAPLGSVALQPTISSSTFDPDGRSWLYTKGRSLYLRPLTDAANGEDRLLRRYDDEMRLQQTRLPMNKRYVRSRDSGDVAIWSFAPDGPVEETVIPRPETANGFMWPEPSGRWVTNSNSGQDRAARLWRVGALPGAQPLSLQRRGSWYMAEQAFDPRADWLVASTGDNSRLTFWPLRKRYPSVVGGYPGLRRPLAFSPDGKWLATNWPSYKELLLSPLEGLGGRTARRLELPVATPWCDLRFDPEQRYVFAVGYGDCATVVPLDGSPPRRLGSFSEDTLLEGAAVSPSGRRVATAFLEGEGSRTLRVWDLDSGGLSQFELPQARVPEGERPKLGGNVFGVTSLHFVDETTLYTAGAGGLHRWDTRDGSSSLVIATGPQTAMWVAMDRQARIALTVHTALEKLTLCHPAQLHELDSGRSRVLDHFGDCVQSAAVSLDGTVAVTGDVDGVVRVGRLSGGPPHALFGHKGKVDRVGVSPDLRWAASAGEDGTLRLWPMPDLDTPPLHTLPREDLVAKLESLTNIRAVRDAETPEGWSIQLDTFPGWKEVPTW